MLKTNAKAFTDLGGHASYGFFEEPVGQLALFLLFQGFEGLGGRFDAVVQQDYDEVLVIPK